MFSRTLVMVIWGTLLWTRRVGSGLLRTVTWRVVVTTNRGSTVEEDNSSVRQRKLRKRNPSVVHHPVNIRTCSTNGRYVLYLCVTTIGHLLDDSILFLVCIDILEFLLSFKVKEGRLFLLILLSCLVVVNNRRIHRPWHDSWDTVFDVWGGNIGYRSRRNPGPAGNCSCVTISRFLTWRIGGNVHTSRFYLHLHKTSWKSFKGPPSLSRPH